jgi:hypothetical protein
MHTGTWSGRRGAGPRTSAHVLDCSQIGALRQPSHHMLGPLRANVVAAQAGVRPPTKSVAHTDTEREREAMQGHTHTQFREAWPKADTYTRTASAHVVRSYRETDICCIHTQTHTHTYTYTALYGSFSVSLFRSHAFSQTLAYTHLTHTHTHTHTCMHLTHTQLVLRNTYTSLHRCHAHTYMCMCTHRYTHTHTDTHTHYRQSYKHTHTHRHIHTSRALPLFPSHTHAHTHERAHTRISLSLSVGLPHTHTLTRTHWTPPYHPHAYRYVGGAEGGRPKDIGTRTRL